MSIEGPKFNNFRTIKNVSYVGSLVCQKTLKPHDDARRATAVSSPYVENSRKTGIKIIFTKTVQYTGTRYFLLYGGGQVTQNFPEKEASFDWLIKY